MEIYLWNSQQINTIFKDFAGFLGESGRRQLGKWEMRTVTLNPACHSSTASVWCFLYCLSDLWTSASSSVNKYYNLREISQRKRRGAHITKCLWFSMLQWGAAEGLRGRERNWRLQWRIPRQYYGASLGSSQDVPLQGLVMKCPWSCKGGHSGHWTTPHTGFSHTPISFAVHQIPRR